MHSRSAYVLTYSHLNRLRNLRLNKCTKCNVEFEEGNIIATSTSKRYCYECGIKINLVSGNIQKDLHNDQLVSNILNEIKILTTKYSIDKEISSFALFLIKTAFENTNYITKNQLGLSCAAISLAASQFGKNENFWNDFLPVSAHVLTKNISELQKILMQARITAFSQNIQRIRN